MVRRRDLDFADVLQAVASQHQLFKSESPAQESPVTGDTHDCGCSPYLQPSENVPIAVDQELFHWAQEAMVPDYFVVAEGAPVCCSGIWSCMVCCLHRVGRILSIGIL
uniref:Uncharacterized protein n=1 Tax=Oxyrrhis marina TaxID=2969 RepID=A0A6U9JK99_OXYMA